MKKIYYFTKTAVTIPCLGWFPIGVFSVYLGFLRSDFGIAALMVGITIAYIWAVYNSASPAITPAFIKSAENHQKFFWVNFVVATVFSVLLIIVGACLWPLLLIVFQWLSNEIFDVKLSGKAEFLWIYFWANSLFHISYLLLWEYVRKHRLIRRLTIPNVCW